MPTRKVSQSKPSQKKSNGATVAAGLGLAAAAVAAAAGALYFYTGKDSSKHRKQLKGWMVKVKGDIMDKLEDLDNITEKTYERVVSEVLANYKKLKKTSPEELAALGKELHGHWKAITAEASKNKRSR